MPLATSRVSTADSTPIEIHYEVFGRRHDPTLVLVNGLGGQCINFRTEWCEMFAAEGFQVVRLDNRDVGLSSAVDAPYDLSDMANDVIAVVDAVGVEQVHLAGVSLGGMIVQTLAIEHADRLLSVTSVMSTTGDRTVGQASPGAQALLLSPPPTDSAAAIDRHIDGLRLWGSIGIDEPLQRRFAAEAFDRAQNPAGVGRQLKAAMASGDRTERLGRVTVPFLVMHGEVDRLIDPSGGRATAAAVPGARLVMLPGMGHDYPVEYWPRWVELITGHARLSATGT